MSNLNQAFGSIQSESLRNLSTPIEVTFDAIGHIHHFNYSSPDGSAQLFRAGGESSFESFILGDNARPRILSLESGGTEHVEIYIDYDE